MKKIITFFIVLSSVFIGARGADICGHVGNTAGQPVDYASVRILSAADSTFVKGDVADDNGFYNVAGLDKGSYIISVTCIGYNGHMATVALTDSVVTRDVVLTPSDSMLGEVVVNAGQFARTPNGVTVHPSKEQVRHSTGGYELIRNIMIPGVSVNTINGEVKALGGSVSLYIDGLPADYRDVKQLRPADVERIQYIDAPTGKYAGDNVALNFILKKRSKGGYVALDAMQRIGYAKGDYNFASKIYSGDTQYTLFTGTGYQAIDGAEISRSDEIRFNDRVVKRDYIPRSAHSRENTQYVQLRVRDKNVKRTLRATFNFVRMARPEDYNSSSLQYSGLAQQPVTVGTSSISTSRSFKYSLGLSGSFNLPAGQFLETSASMAFTRNHYGYGYSESDNVVASSTAEDYYNFSANLSYGYRFSRGNSIVFKANEIFNVSSATYMEQNRSWQHLWSSETLAFVEYLHPLWGKASVRVAPGVSTEFYRLHGARRESYAGPRMQLVFAIQPTPKQFAQLSALYGNSFPQLSMMSAASRQVDMVQERRGNPHIKVTRMLRLMAVYGIGIGKVNLQAVGLFNGASRLPVTRYFTEGDKLVETYAPYGSWRQIDMSLSATWMPSQQFNMQVSGGWLENRYSGDASVSASCLKASAQVSWYIGGFAVNGRVETPVTMAGYDLRVTDTPWIYGLSLSWSRGQLMIEAGADNPLSRHPVYRHSISTDIYRMSSTSFSVTDRRSAYIRFTWSVDFGKKTSRDKINVDRSISTGILK